MTIAPLDRAQILTMVGEISARFALSREAAEHLVERTGGVPLFVEEVARLLSERGGQGYEQTLPPTLQQSLAARLDRLGPAREVAMVGSVLGREFSYALLGAVAELDEAALEEALEKLAEAGILIVDGLTPDANYRFKHALIQDSAYETLLKSRRQTLHRRAAETMREPVRRSRRGGAGSARAPFHARWPRRRCDRMVGQGRRSGDATFGVPRSDRPFRQGDRLGRQGELRQRRP